VSVAVLVLFLGWLAVRGGASRDGVEPRAAGFVRVWAVVFALEAIVDLVATGPLGWRPLPFVLLRDYRVFALVLVVMQPGRARPVVLFEAVVWTLVVPAVAYGTMRLVDTVSIPQPDTMLWIVYEIAFVALVDALVAWLLPRRVEADREPVRRYVRAVLGLAVLSYALWALADVLILNGIDRGWALRVLPSQLSYTLLVPFAYARFFSVRSVSAASTEAAL